ncbi:MULTISPECIES: DUF1232 domain-containing protein [unclassified Chelatococcus]|uniref:YkvA family protein n=1 Tax=unclassified Chelatococcus TaxID=2638111 RepID=UPI001BCD8E3E|nr:MULTISPECIES: DUF1232 domain-containing protein [unclassified Chelatococcus]MBS7699095.1 DUF1232 domain-containing protein [Chelatococcus sp. YT9]MBX3554876.1 DUF1232 domain-containing protein [Chelatococcus sp.]
MLIVRAKLWARIIKQDVLALWIASRDSRTPWYAKVAAGAVAAYALSPIDLIPDFIPVLGYLDDLIIVPLGILLVIKLIPAPLMAEYRAVAAEQSKHTSYGGMIAIVALWLVAAVPLFWWLWLWVPRWLSNQAL